jgi:phosphoglycerate dehydrogenase-like enzyme
MPSLAVPLAAPAEAQRFCDPPLRDLPDVLVTPHDAASSQHRQARVLDPFVDDLGRLERAEPLLNRIDKTPPV